MRAAAAQKTLNELERRLDQREGRLRSSMTSALKELSDVLEALQVASEQLNTFSDALAFARSEAVALAERYRELHEGLPLPCVLTNDSGNVDEANSLAATLLNVARPYLPGKPLLLFLPEREQYFQFIESLQRVGNAAGRAQLRPRDRKPREVQINANALPHQSRWCWVFSDFT
jgi:PAS domain-containing protein